MGLSGEFLDEIPERYSRTLFLDALFGSLENSPSILQTHREESESGEALFYVRHNLKIVLELLWLWS